MTATIPWSTRWTAESLEHHGVYVSQPAKPDNRVPGSPPIGVGTFIYYGPWFGKVITTDEEIGRYLLAKHYDDGCSVCGRHRRVVECDGADEQGTCKIVCFDCR